MATDEEKLLEQQVQAILDEIDFSGWTVLSNGLVDQVKEIAGDGAVSTLLALGLDEKDNADVFNVVNETALDFATARGAEMVGMRVAEDGSLIPNPDPKWAITDGTREMLRSTVRDAIRNGPSPGELRQQIVDNHAFSEARALNIARTETARAFGQGSLAAAKKSGVVGGKEWDLSSEHPDPDECDDNADDGVIGLDEDFSSGDPCEPAHPSCECAVRYLVDDDEGEEAE